MSCLLYTSREELVKRLEEYRRVKAAAEYLEARKHIGESMFFKEPDKIEKPPAEWNYSKPVSYTHLLPRLA